MKQVHRWMTAVLFAGSLGANAQTPLADDVKIGRFHGLLVIEQPGEPRVLVKAGQADHTRQLDQGLDVAYPLASVSKSITAVAVLRLVDRDELQLTQTLAELLPEFADKPAASVTLEQLLGHTSGIPSLYQRGQGLDASMDPAHWHEPISSDALIAQFIDAPLLFAPGARYGYSNSGYVLLAKILERRTGKSFAEVLEQEVFAPADMRHACYCAQVPGVANAIAYTLGDEPAAIVHHTRAGAAGGLRATPRAMLKFGRALLGDELLSPARRELMWRAHSATPRPGRSYGLGWIVDARSGHPRVGHDGAIPGTVVQFQLEPETRRVGFAVLNRTHELEQLNRSESYLAESFSAAFESRPGLVPHLADTRWTAMPHAFHLPGGRSFELNADASGIWLVTDGSWSVFNLAQLVEQQDALALKANALVKDWAEQGQAGLQSSFSANLASNLPEGALDGMWQQLLAEHGAFERSWSWASDPARHHASVRLKFARAALDIAVVYNAAGELDGLQLLGEERTLPPVRVRAWPTADGDLWIDGYALGLDDLRLTAEHNDRQQLQALRFGQAAALRATPTHPKTIAAE